MALGRHPALRRGTKDGTLTHVPWTVPRTIGYAALLAAACGPGLEMMHESNLRFEHCYRLDMDPQIAPSHREHCWRDWTEVYAYGQALDRVEYARRRIVDLEAGDTSLLTIHEGHRPTARVFAELGGGAKAAEAPMAAPAPTSAHAPPPKTEPVAPVPSASAAETPPPRPGEACSSECTTSLGECSRLCEAKQADCAACREAYRRCMRRCFE